jgi:hypothetical protein
MIREAMATDVARIVEMGRQFLLEGPYKDIIEDHPEIPTALAEKLLALPNAKILVSVDDGRVEGVVAFILYPHFYSGIQTAQELIWYCTPEVRHSFTPICLMRAAQRIAKEMGAKYMQFTAPTVEIGKLYEMSGYSQIEVGYQKRL